jgi:UrcA family protein
MFTKSKLVALVFVAGIGAMVGVQAASAQSLSSNEDTVSVRVSYGDINLGSQAGAKTMVARIHRAAEQVCGPQPDHKALDLTRSYDRCVSSAVGGAVASINRPSVTALNGRQSPLAPIALASARP